MRPLFHYGHAVKIVLNHGAKCEVGFTNRSSQMEKLLLSYYYGIILSS